MQKQNVLDVAVTTS